VEASLPVSSRGAGSAELHLSLRRTTTGEELPVVHLAGEFDLDTVPEIDRFLRRRLGPFYHGGHLILDLEGVRFVDSSFVGYLVTLVTRLHENGKELLVTRPRGHVRKVLGAVGLPNVVPVYDSVEEGVEVLLRGRLPVIPPRFTATRASRV
jgi:anti-anti-sigma factor